MARVDDLVLGPRGQLRAGARGWIRMLPGTALYAAALTVMWIVTARS